MKSNKRYMVAGICCVAGLLIFLVGFALLRFDFRNLDSSSPYEEKQYTSKAAIQSVQLEESDANLVVTRSADQNTHLTYAENDEYYYEIEESKDGTLSILKKSSLKWTDYIFNFNINVKTQTLELALPADFKGELSCLVKSGMIKMDGVSAQTLDAQTYDGNMFFENLAVDGTMSLKTGDGNISLVGLSAKGASKATTSDGNISFEDVDLDDKLDLKTGNGKIALSDVSAKETVGATTSDGEIHLQDLRAKELNLKTSDGKIMMDGVSINDSIYAKTSDGDVMLDRVLFGQNLTALVSSGNINGSIVGSISDFSFDCRAGDGRCNLPEELSGGPKTIQMKTSDGNINIDFVPK